MTLWKRVFLGLVLGVLVGAVFGEKAELCKPLGTIFINLILMVVIPLIFFVLVNGITSVDINRNLTRIGIKSILVFLSTATLAVLLGIIITSILKPGVGIPLQLGDTAVVTQRNISDILLSIVPSNALKSMVEGNIIHVIIFAFFVGITLNSAKESCSNIIKLVNEMATLMITMITTITKLSPYGVFGYMAFVVGTQGIEVLTLLGKLVLTIMLCCLLQYLIFGLLILSFAKLSPIPFYRKIFPIQLMALSTSSSKATLADLIKVTHQQLGVSRGNTNLLIPLSSALNMDGGALYLGSCVVFFSQALGVDLVIGDYLILMVTCTIGSIGAAGIPSGIILFLGMALSSIGLPIEIVAVVAGVDRILDMITTMINVTGDACCTLLIDESEGELDKNRYNTMELKLNLVNKYGT